MYDDCKKEPVAQRPETERQQWSECPLEEKIERLREELRGFRYFYGRIGRVEAQIRQLQKHEHGIDGKPTISLIDNSNYGDGADCLRAFDGLA